MANLGKVFVIELLHKQNIKKKLWKYYLEHSDSSIFEVIKKYSIHRATFTKMKFMKSKSSINQSIISLLNIIGWIKNLPKLIDKCEKVQPTIMKAMAKSQFMK